ncbi:hypothetical protein B0909_24660 [Rhizobium rhizogenes]|nr:hypothetical protein B0909_24660 [Rhizobium rhizogenes]
MTEEKRHEAKTPVATTTQALMIPPPKNEKAGLFTRLHHSLRRNTYSRKPDGFTGVASLRTSK